MYPLSVTQPNFFWDNGSNQFLDMTQANVNDTSIYPNGTADCLPYIASLLQFRPAIQVKELLKLIIQRAGFRYTSSFIDGAYFGKVFMTTGNHLGESTVPTENTTENDWAGNMLVGRQGTCGIYNFPSSPSGSGTPCLTLTPILVLASQPSGSYDNQDAWNVTNNYFTKLHPTMNQIGVAFNPSFDNNNLEGCNNSPPVVDIYLQGFDASTNTPLTDVVYAETTENML